MLTGKLPSMRDRQLKKLSSLEKLPNTKLSEEIEKVKKETKVEKKLKK